MRRYRQSVIERQEHDIMDNFSYTGRDKGMNEKVQVHGVIERQGNDILDNFSYIETGKGMNKKIRTKVERKVEAH